MNDAFETGSLRLTSYANRTKSVTGNDDLITVDIVRLNAAVFRNVLQKVIDLRVSSVLQEN